jgi:Xaa-Pro aminopeptidase
MKSLLVALTILTLVLVHGSDVLSQIPGQSDLPPLEMGVYKARRQVLLDSLGEGTAVLYSSGRHTDTGYRAGSDFWYLTGNDEPGAVLVLAPKEVDREVMLLTPRDTEAERWTGMRPSLSESLQVAWGFDRVRRTNSLNRMLVTHMKHDPVLHLISGLVSPEADVPKDMELYGEVRARIPGVSLENASHLIEHMRMMKSDEEIARIEKAIAVTHQGITDLLAAVEPGIGEFQLDGILEQSFKRQGAQHMAFPPIVGSGEQTTILHYEKRNLVVKPGQLLLLDVGAEWDHYAADISRTVPVDGTFTPEQARIYDIVYQAQSKAIEAVKPGVTVREVHEIARDVIRQAGYVDDFIHGTSHHLGLDVHDVADYGMALEPGMVITVEPGIYLPDVDIGVRIEDDVLVTRNGYRLLSKGIPRERSAVERWVQEARQ